MDFLYEQFGPLTGMQWAGIVVGLLVLNWVRTAVFGGKKRDAVEDSNVPARCLSCSWQGRVSKYHRTCPKCGMSITKLSRHGP